MKNIPHDYYLKFVNPSVYDEVLDFHSSGNYTIHEAFQRRTCLHSISDENIVQLTGNELRLYADMDLTFPVSTSSYEGLSSLYRNESCEHFLPSKIDFSIVEKLVGPLLSRNKESYKRGYPSGGALYPVEVFICSLFEGNHSWPYSGKVLHLLPNSGRFEVVQSAVNVDQLKKSLLTVSQSVGCPSFALIYMVYLPKVIFKYRYRGYRLALMEVGSIYMLVELRAKSLGLVCRLWSGYTDTMLSKSLGLNPAMFLPMCVHFVGEAHESI